MVSGLLLQNEYCSLPKQPSGAQLLMSLAKVCHQRLMRTFSRTFIIDCIIRCAMIRLMFLVPCSGWHTRNCLRLEQLHAVEVASFALALGLSARDHLIVKVSQGQVHDLMKRLTWHSGENALKKIFSPTLHPVAVSPSPTPLSCPAPLFQISSSSFSLQKRAALPGIPTEQGITHFYLYLSSIFCLFSFLDIILL